MKLQSYTIVERIALGFLHVNEDVLFPLVTFWILDGGIYLAKDAQIIKILLRVQHINLAQRVACLHCNLALHDKRACVIESRYKDLIHKNPLALMNSKSHVNVISIAGWLGGGLE